MIYLALKQDGPAGFWPRQFAALTRWRLQTKYPHGGIVVTDDEGRNCELLHSNLANGLHALPFSTQPGKGWTLLRLPESKAVEAKQRFSELKGAKYDWFSLLAFALPLPFSDARRIYCFEWCWLVMTGVNPNFRVTPEMLLAKALELGDSA